MANNPAETPNTAHVGSETGSPVHEDKKVTGNNQNNTDTKKTEMRPAATAGPAAADRGEAGSGKVPSAVLCGTFLHTDGR